jgi:protease-4
MGLPLPGAAGIGVLELFGPITGGRKLREYANSIEDLKNSRRFKAVVLNVDSPGGLATASDCLYSAMSRLSAKKPVIAFVSGNCASGAYMVCCAATRIVALQTSIIGSIGVLSVRPILHDLLDRVGVHVSVTKSGRLKDMGSFFRDPTEEEKKKEEELISGFYDYFVSVVAKGRKMDESKVRELATGEVFLGEKSKALGLVDEIGDADFAVDLAADLGKVRRRLIHVRRRPSLPERLFLRFADTMLQETMTEAEGLLHRRIYYLG